MTLDEEIKYCEEVADFNTKEVENGTWRKDSMAERFCIESANERLQLAEWLKELKVYKEKESKWIPISERLPEEGEDVLVTICKRSRKLYVMSAEYYGGFFRNEEIYECAKAKECIVKAWMIPEPYKAESEEV